MQETQIETHAAFEQLRQANAVLTHMVMQILNERHHLEGELIKANRLEALAVMAGGIAHDFNNILTTILGNVSLAKMLASQDEKLIQRLDSAEKAASRARDLTRQLLTMSKDNAPAKQLASIRDVIQEAVDFSLRGSNIRYELSLQAGLWPVEIDAGQMSQVIHNLMINAEHAMPDGGVICVGADNCRLDAARVADLTPLSPGRYVHVAVQDQGCGIAAEQLQHIFDPYFTTKREGNGLGLATAHTIMQQHGGAICAESAVGVGSTFHLYLPAALVRQTPQASIGADASETSGVGRILMLEDDAALRDAIGKALELLGYEIVFAEDGFDALSAYRQARAAGESFDAVVLDLTIPGGMGGGKTVAELLSLDPQVKAIVTSGYAHDPMLVHFEQYGFCGALAKPYRAEQLHHVLRKVTAAPANALSLPDHA